MNSKFKYLIKDTLIFALGSFGSKIILFFLVPLYTNYMSKEEYGIAEYVFTIAQLFIPIVSVSIWEGIIRIGLKTNIKKQNILYNSLIIFCISTLLVFLITPLWNLYQPIRPWKYFLSTYMVMYILNQIELNYLKIIDKNKLFALASIIQTFVLAIMNIFLIMKMHYGVQGYLLSNIIAIFVANIFIILFGNLIKYIIHAQFDFSLLKSMLIYSIPLIVNNISWWFIHSSDKIMIQTMLSSAELGLYTVSTKMPSLINVFVSIFTQAWGISSIKEMESSNDSEYYTKVFEVYSVFLVGAIIFLTSIIKPFMSIYVGKNFSEAWKYVSLLLLAAIFQAFSSYFGALLGALQKSFKTMITTLIGGISNIILNYIFIKTIGIWGAIIGTLCAFIIVTIQRILIVNKNIHLTILWKKFIINSCLCLTHAILVSLNIHIYIISILTICLYIIINFYQLKNIIKFGVNILNNFKFKKLS